MTNPKEELLKMLAKKKVPVNRRHGVDIYSLPDEGYNWCRLDSVDLLAQRVATVEEVAIKLCSIIHLGSSNKENIFRPCAYCRKKTEALQSKYILIRKGDRGVVMAEGIGKEVKHPLSSGRFYKEHEHQWNYYHIVEEAWTQPPEGVTGDYTSHKYSDTVHYRACGCGRIEKNKDGKWEEK